MGKARCALTAIVLAAVALVDAPAMAAAVADLAVTTVSAPAEVSPPGGAMLARDSVVNNGPAPAPADVVHTATGGALFLASQSSLPAGCTAPADGTVDPTITCHFQLLVAGETRHLKIALQTANSPGSVTNTVTVSVPPNPLDPVVDDQPDNDSASVTTPVLDDADQSSALVRPGETLAFQQSTLSVAPDGHAVIVALRVAPGDGDVCGTTTCGDGLRLLFDTDPDFQGTVALDVSFGRGDPCRGLGPSASCEELFIRKLGAITPVPRCADAPTADPCIVSVYKTPAAEFHWRVRMHSTDPDLLPPLRG